MYKLLPLIAAIHVGFAAPAVVFDYNCVPDVVCSIVATAASKGMLGLSNINEYNIVVSKHLLFDRVSCLLSSFGHI